MSLHRRTFLSASLALGAGALVYSVGDTDAKDESSNPVIERIVAAALK